MKVIIASIVACLLFSYPSYAITKSQEKELENLIKEANERRDEYQVSTQKLPTGFIIRRDRTKEEIESKIKLIIASRKAEILVEIAEAKLKNYVSELIEIETGKRIVLNTTLVILYKSKC